MPRGRTARSLAGLAAAALLAGGCAEQPRPAATLPPLSTPTATAPTLAPLGPPDLPMPAEARTREGFNEFTRYYIGLVNRLNDDLDPTWLRQFSRDCATCDRIANDAASDAALGRSLRGPRLTITEMAPPHVSGDRGETAFLADQSAYSVLDAAGNPVPGLTDKPALLGLSSGMAGEWAGDHWIVTELTLG